MLSTRVGADSSLLHLEPLPTFFLLGKVPMDQVDGALFHLFMVQFRLGLFDPSAAQVRRE